MSPTPNTPAQRRGMPGWAWGLIGCITLLFLTPIVISLIAAVTVPRMIHRSAEARARAEQSVSSDTSTFNGSTGKLQGHFAALAYEGTVERKELGENYQYTLRDLHLKLSPTGTPEEIAKYVGTPDQLRASKLAFENIQLVATKKPTSGDKDTPYEGLFLEKKPFTVILTLEKSTVALPPYTFVIPKAKVAQADHVGFGISTSNAGFFPLGPSFK